MKKYCTDLSENVMFSYLTLSCHSTHIIKRVNTYKVLRTFPLRHTNDDIVIVIMLPTSSSFSLILSPVLVYFSVGSANKNTENLILFLILFYFLLSIK